MPDPGFKGPLSSSSLNIFNFQPPPEVVTSNPGFGKRTTARSHSIYNPKPFNTQNRTNILEMKNIMDKYDFSVLERGKLKQDLKGSPLH